MGSLFCPFRPLLEGGEMARSSQNGLAYMVTCKLDGGSPCSRLPSAETLLQYHTEKK